MFPDIDTVRQYIQTTILNDPDNIIEKDQDLLLSGLLDSLSVVKLVAWLEKECELSIPAEDVLVENFGTLTSIETYLNNRSAS